MRETLTHLTFHTVALNASLVTQGVHLAHLADFGVEVVPLATQRVEAPPVTR